MNNKDINVITVDGPSGTGKGTIGQLLAQRLGYHYLDSGALYRLLALAAMRHKVPLDNVDALTVLAGHMDISFEMNCDGDAPVVILEGEDVSSTIRTEEMAVGASTVAVIPEVRQALLGRQRAFVDSPGLVADGRDMGTVVFPDARVKIFLTASPEERADRRYKQLMDKGESVSLAALVESVRTRDERDSNRQVSPLRPAADAIVLDTTGMTISQVLDRACVIVSEILSR